MGFVLKYVQDTKAGKRYRRKFPLDVKEELGGRDFFLKPIGSTHSEIVKNYPKAHEEFEQKVAKARAKQRGETEQPSSLQSDFQEYQALLTRMRDKGFDPSMKAFDEAEWHSRDREAERVMSTYPTDPETGDPEDMDYPDLTYVRALYSGAGKRPDPTFGDAVAAYIEERGLREPREKANLKRVERVTKYVREALRRDPTLLALNRQDARQVVAFMNNLGNSPATVVRYLNDVRAIINHGITEFELITKVNPFLKLNPKKDGPDRERRRPFTHKEITDISERIERRANTEIQLIWRLLRATGCRNSEIIGLRCKDVHLDHKVPYIFIEWHEQRRLKTFVSVRRIPLVGDGLVAAREAVTASADNDLLFPRYAGRPNGADSASQIMMKHVRAIIDGDPKAVVYSLRHNMKDWLRLAEVPQNIQEEISGRTSGGDGTNYGGYDAMLIVHQKHMIKVSEIWPF